MERGREIVCVREGSVGKRESEREAGSGSGSGSGG